MKKYAMILLMIMIASELMALPPVTIISFEANMKNGFVEIKWKTATELNNYGYFVERNYNGGIFEQIGFVSGHGTSYVINEYTYLDSAKFFEGKYGYRLKQMDNDGVFIYVTPVYVNYTTDVTTEPLTLHSFRLNAYPNPFNSEVNITYEIPFDASYSIIVTDLLGRQVFRINEGYLSKGQYKTSINFNRIPSGDYFVCLVSGSHKIIKKIVHMK